jgi:hypothetical protein
MSLNSLQDDMSRRAASMAAMAKRSSNPQDIQAIQKSLVDGVQNGSIQPYVGIPLIQELTQKLTEAKAQMAQGIVGAGMQQGQEGVPIAQQVMQQAAQADQPQGLEALPSNLPQDYAGGGIIAFEDGGAVQRFQTGDLVDERYNRSSSYYQQPQEEPDVLKRPPLTIQDQVKQYRDLMEAIPKGASQKEYEEYLKNRSGAAEATKKQDLNLALAQFGLNLAAGKSPRALENLGEAGIKTLPAVQEAYKQRRLADETALRGRAELDRMSRAEQLEALKGGVGLYGKEREIAAELEKARLQRENALAVAKAQREGYKPTDLGNYVNDFVAFNLKDPKNTKSVEQLKVEAYNKYPGYVVRENIAGLQAGVQGGAQALTKREQDLAAQTTAIKEFNDLPMRHPTMKAFKAAARRDQENAAAGKITNEADQVMRDYINKVTPGAKPPPPPPPPPPKGAAPSIASVSGAPPGSKIGAYTKNGWEVKDKNGALIGYTRSN